MGVGVRYGLNLKLPQLVRDERRRRLGDHHSDGEAQLPCYVGSSQSRVPSRGAGKPCTASLHRLHTDTHTVIATNKTYLLTLFAKLLRPRILKLPDGCTLSIFSQTLAPTRLESFLLQRRGVLTYSCLAFAGEGTLVAIVDLGPSWNLLQPATVAAL